MRLTKENHRNESSDTGTEMVCFAWSDVYHAKAHHCARDWGEVVAH